MSDESLSELSNQFLAACLLTLKHYMEGNWLDASAANVSTGLVADIRAGRVVE